MITLDALVYEGLLQQPISELTQGLCGLLFGPYKESVTHIAPLKNISLNHSTELRFHIGEFTQIVASKADKQLYLQGIYYTSTRDVQPGETVINRWRHNVPCFIICQPSTGETELHVYTIDLVLKKAAKIPFTVKESVLEEPAKEDTPLPAAPPVVDESVVMTLGRDVTTGETVELSYSARRLSTYVIGAMGMGKTTLLLNLALSDIARGDGLCVLEPHGDLTYDILGRIPPQRERDMIVWEPFDIERPFGLNLFECADITNSNLVDRVCSQAIETFYKLFHESWGPRMEELLRATFLTLIHNQNLPAAKRPTLAEIPRLFTDKAYRSFLVSRVPNPAVQDFWRLTYDSLRPKEQEEYYLSSLNKIHRFLFNPTICNIIGQAQNSLNLRQIMDEGKILLVNLSKGKLGEENSALLGSILVGQFLTATLSRSDIPFAQRRPFHLIVDEYQNFATSAFATLQTEARKFGLDTVVAHQTRAMLSEESQGTSTVVGNTICFRVAGEDAQEMARMFDNLPPEPPVTGVQPIRSHSTAPWDHLTRHGHSNPRVNELLLVLKAALTTIPKYRLPDFQDIWWSDAEMARTPARLPLRDVRRFITEEDVRRFEDLLNTYLYQRMNGMSRYALLSDEVELMMLGPFYERFTWFEKREQFTVHVSKLSYEFLVYNQTDSALLAQEQAKRQEEFYAALDELAELLQQEPIWADSGQLQEIRDKPRLFSDVAAETANTLSALHPYQALCRIMDTHGHRIQCRIQTNPPPALALDATDLVSRLTNRSRERYGRPRQAVEDALRERTAQPSEREQPPPVAAPPRPPSRGAKSGRRTDKAPAPPPPKQESPWEPIDSP